MNENVSKKSVGLTIGVGLVTLVLGVLIGGGGVLLAKRTASPPQVTKVTSASISAPDTSVQPKQQSSVWNPFTEIQDMQARMDRMFQQSFDRLRASPNMDVFKNNNDYSLSLSVRDLKNHYEVQALLPDAKASNAKVNLKGNQLEVSVSDKQSNKNGQIATSEWGRYDESIHLAGNLNPNGMKVERNGHELLITIPKA